MPSDLPLVPWPRKAERSDGWVGIGPVAVDTSAPELRRVTLGLVDGLVAVGARRGEAGSPATLRIEIDRSLAEEEYRLEIDAAIELRCGSPVAAAWGGATLLQLAERVGSFLRLPRVTIEDRPDCGWRGLLVDVAREPHSLATLKQLVELCRLYKIRWLQLHLTDDAAFTFPSAAFPRLAADGRSFTRAELEELEAFSQARGVTIVPELDMPGHCGALIGAMPEPFRASPKHPATLNFARLDVIAAMRTLVDELMGIFPSSPWFHLGGDECDLAFVHENPDFPAAFAREGVADAQGLYGWFLTRMHEHVQRRGRRAVVWEGFRHGARPAIPRDVVVMVYEALHHLPGCLLADGYEVVNASWRPLYVVNDRRWSPEEIHRWARTRWRHYVEGSPSFGGLEVAPSPRLLGAQMCAWEQPDAREVESLRPRLPALSERLWSPGAGRDYADFARRFERADATLSALLASIR